MEIQERVAKLRKLMEDNGMDAYIIPSSDSHLSEYVADHFKSRQWISGFTGSAGTVVITLKDAGLWTDGRYYIQAEQQLQNSGIRLFRAADPKVPSYTEWIREHLPEGSALGFDGHVFSAKQLKDMEKELDGKIAIKFNQDLVGQLWKDRPSIPAQNIFVHDVGYAGRSRIEKLNDLRQQMKGKGANVHLLTALDDIAWLLNIRGDDVPNNPVTIAYVLVAEETCYLCIDEGKVPATVKTELEEDGIQIKGYAAVTELLQGLQGNDSILIDPESVNAVLYHAIHPQVKKVEGANPSTLLKAIKNETELDNLRTSNTYDGVAMVRFIKWLKTAIGKEEITELSAGDTLEALRRENKECVGLSFDTIAGYKDHAAMMHYKATSENAYTLKAEGFLLVDSGGQYFGGTTDITRTIVLGPLTEEEKRDFTLVLKGHIALATVKFLYGATGSNLDVLARQPIWKYGMDYKCGTGHGVGMFLNVHEGPQRLSQMHNATKLEDGMILTNEPGIYKEGKHGIRTENMMVVIKDEETEFGQFMRFEALTYCPIDLAGVDQSLLTDEEQTWLDEYNKMVYDKLESYLNEEEKAWLAQEIRM
ncbi:Xaa-Pro aminopeptidase [Desulfitobacterium dehalogenans ATCC 51507]|uniref:Xaa-Pro aminopeptidase n=1 Tax=Desulfitobacterium dehalogenans (strain ATCC 51507 / DSM 9161 / JW/IU-DC1) TaxID=756499 RepID=I4AE23_DESDJ|nr:aminopeptidase P family protein [Desulfitobacterium dehalogenans]AFM02208.1 Xaa-Pro aminopeptidase [Desulfitobacterium dehalogenans ATCC 51507]